jgi:hypothetical protein
MSTSDLQPDDSRTEELVAYLDGELPDEAARLVEQRLASDDDYRRQLGELDQAWSALEALPTPTANDRFARTTIEMVALAAQRDLTQQSSEETARGRKQVLAFAAAGLALFAAGFALARIFLPSQNRALIADLPAVVHIDELTQVGDIDFLRGLTKLDLQQFTNEDESRARAADFDLASASGDNPESRRQWVERLSAEQKAELAGRLQRFQSLPGGPEEQRRMRQLETDIEQAPDHAELQSTMAAYAQWLSGQSQGKQAELRDLASAQRVVQVEKHARQSNHEAARKLTSEEEQALRAAINKFADDHRTEVMEEMRRDNPDSPRRAEKEPKFANLGIVMQAMRDEKWRDELHTQLVAALSEPSKQYLEHLSPRMEQPRQLMRWLWTAMNPKFGPQELERFFSDKLSNDQREQLMNLPQAEMESRLERWYTASQLGIPEQNWGTFDFDRGGRGGLGGQGFGRGVRDRDNGPPGRGDGPRGEGGPRGEFGPRRGDRGPGGQPDGPPPGGPREGGPRNGGRRPGGPPPDDQNQPPPPGPPPR